MPIANQETASVRLDTTGISATTQEVPIARRVLNEVADTTISNQTDGMIVTIVTIDRGTTIATTIVPEADRHRYPEGTKGITTSTNRDQQNQGK
jgi:hypothetical protein